VDAAVVAAALLDAPLRRAVVPFVAAATAVGLVVLAATGDRAVRGEDQRTGTDHDVTERGTSDRADGRHCCIYFLPSFS